MSKKAIELPPLEILDELIAYDKETGELFWKHREAKHFNASAARTKESIQEQWNSRYAGTVAGNLNKFKGYQTIKILCKAFAAHRLAYLMATGVNPLNMQIDHINGIRDDNRFSNLRLVNSSGNNRNRSMHTNNTSGTMGISSYQHKPDCWVGVVQVDGKNLKITNPRTGLKYFEDFEKTELERLLEAKRREVGYHENHGQSKQN